MKSPVGNSQRSIRRQRCRRSLLVGEGRRQAAPKDASVDTLEREMEKPDGGT